MRKLTGFSIIGCLLALILLTGVPAQAGNNAQVGTWSAAIAYFNPTNLPGELTVSYYPENGEPIDSTSLEVNSKYSGTLLVGATSGMEGAAVINTTFNMPAVYKSAASSGDPASMILLELFNAAQVGDVAVNGGKFYLSGISNNTQTLSRVGIQNIEGSLIDVTLTFLSAAPSTSLYTVTIQNIEPLTSTVFLTSELSTTPALPADFNGSLLVTALLDGTSTPAQIVAAATTQDAASGRLLNSYQGTASGSTTIFIPAGLCDGRSDLETILEIQNVSGAAFNAASLSVNFRNPDTGASILLDNNIASGSLPDGRSVRLEDICTAPQLADQHFSAVINAPAGVAVLAALSNPSGLQAAYVVSTNYDQPDGDGQYHVTLPYVEWSSSSMGVQSMITIMNTGAGAPATVTATFYRRDGSSVPEQSFSITQHGVIETNPNLVPGLISMSDRNFQGAVELMSDQPIMAVVLVTRNMRAADGSTQTRGDAYLGLQFISE